MKKIAVLSAGVVLLLFLVMGCGSQDSGTGSLKVTVTNGGTTPVSGAKVVSGSQPDGQLKVTGITNSDGTVIFNDIKTGTYQFYVTAAGFIQQEFEATVTSGHTAETTVYIAPEQ